MKSVIAIDPGPERSALLEWDSQRHVIVQSVHEPNAELVARLTTILYPVPVVIEKVESYGMAVGAETFETVYWSGVFAEAVGRTRVYRMGRKPVKIHHCGSARATDANIRAAIIDSFGGAEKAIGKKAQPGPLYFVKGHAWAALALAIAWSETQGGAANA